MATTFSRMMAQLRAETGVSQKNAAQALGVSQALLSHYETGAREPGFAFLVRAADYYQVSADFLLGRVPSRDGREIKVDDLHDATLDKDSQLNGIPSAKLGKRLILNSLSILYDILGKSRSGALTAAVTAFLGRAVTHIFYLLYKRNGCNLEGFFPVQDHLFMQSSFASLLKADIRLQTALNDKKKPVEYPQISGEALGQAYPELAQSLLTVLHQAANQN